MALTIGLCSCGGGGSGSSGNSGNSTSPIGTVTDSDISENRVSESAASGTSAGITLSASDPDPGDTVSYGLIDDAGGMFSINSSTGVVSVASSLDYEEVSSHTIRALAQSADGTTSEGNFSIEVTDDPNDPVLSFSFPVTDPAAVVYYTGSEIDVAGTVVDPLGQAVSVKVTSGNSIVGAPIDVDGNWRAENVPIKQDGSASVNLEIEVQSGSLSDKATISISTASQLGDPLSIAIDALHGRALVFDRELSALISVDLQTGDRDTVSDGQRGTGNRLQWPGWLAVDAQSDRAYIKSAGQFLSIDLSTGNRTVVSDVTTGTGPLPEGFPGDLSLDRAGSRLIVTDEDRLLTVDLVTGNRSVISGAGVGTGPMLERATSLFVINNNQVLVVDGNGVLLSVDLGTGNRTLIASDTNDDGSGLEGRPTITVDSGRNRALVANHGSSVFSVDLATGDMTEFSGDEVGTGLDIIGTVGIAWDSQNDRAITVDSAARLLSLDAATGDRSLFSGNNVGDGDVFFNMSTEINLDLQRDRAIFTAYPKSVLAVDMHTGNRTTLFDETSGSGPGMNVGQRSLYDAAKDRLLMIYDGLVSLDLQTGNRTRLSDAYNLGMFVDMVLDPATNRLFATMRDPVSVLAIDLSTGAGTILSGASRGSGPEFSDLDGLVLDSMRNRILLPDYGVFALFAVDMTTGDRTIVADFTTGAGDPLYYVNTIDLDEDSGRLFLTTGGKFQQGAGLYELDLATGERSEISSLERGQGVFLNDITDMKLDPGHNRAFVIHNFGRELLIVDLSSGDRVIFSADSL